MKVIVDVIKPPLRRDMKLSVEFNARVYGNMSI